ncbi:MAG: GspH/FimT family protein [Lysobacter sp.]|nr:GspH/FimT family protein [Lysobacter sp.]
MSAAPSTASPAISLAGPTRARRSAPRFARRCGFTLLDALLGMSIAALVFGFAIPNYRAALAHAHATSARSAMTMTLYAAMREAAVNGRDVVICPSAKTEYCAGGIDWSDGWVAFIDMNGDRNRGPNEPSIRRQPELSGDVRLRSTRGRPRLVVQPNGSNAGSNVTFTLCDRRGPSRALRLVLANNGRLRALPARAGDAVACTEGW